MYSTCRMNCARNAFYCSIIRFVMMITTIITIINILHRRHRHSIFLSLLSLSPSLALARICVLITGCRILAATRAAPTKLTAKQTQKWFKQSPVHIIHTQLPIDAVNSPYMRCMLLVNFSCAPFSVHSVHTHTHAREMGWMAAPCDSLCECIVLDQGLRSD